MMSNPYRSTILVTGGNILVKSFAFLAMIILMRGLSPAQFGAVMTMVSMMSILHVIMDFGSGSSFLKIFPGMKAAGLIDDVNDLLGSALFLRAVIGIPVFLIGIPLAGPLAALLLKDPGARMIVIIAFAGGLTGACYQFFLIVFQADEAFRKLVMTQLLDAVFKAAGAAIVVFVFTGAGVSAGVGVFASAPLAAAVIAYIFFGKDLPPPQKPRRKQLKTFFRFSSWYMVSTISIMVFMNFDYLILAAARPAAEVGYFGSASRLGMMFFLIVQAINTVLMPYVGKITRSSEMLRFFYKAQIRTAILSVLVFPAIFIGPWLIRWVAGTDYLPAVSTYYWIALDQVAQLVFTPLMVVLFGINRPRFLTGYVLAEAILNILGDILVVSRFGADGVAAVTLIVRVLVGTIGSIHVVMGLRRVEGFIHSIHR